MAKRLTMPGVESAPILGQEALFAEKPATPVPTLDRIVSWFSEPGGPVVRLTMPGGQATAVHRAPGPARCPASGRSNSARAIFSACSASPRTASIRPAPTVIFLNVGLIGHQGPGRLWVELARACAAAGNVRCLRVDLSGIGDSPARPGRAELRGFPHDAPEDMEDIRRAVTKDGVANSSSSASAPGADHSIETALAGPVAGSLRHQSGFL